jgi:hypothetical protein
VLRLLGGCLPLFALVMSCGSALPAGQTSNPDVGVTSGPADTGSTADGAGPEAAAVIPDVAAVIPDAAAIGPDAAAIGSDAAATSPDAAAVIPDAAGTEAMDLGEPDALVTPPGVCARACATGGMLQCPGSTTAAACVSECEAAFTMYPRCRSQLEVAFDCAAARPPSDWECNSDGEAVIKDGVCDAEVQRLIQCLFAP